MSNYMNEPVLPQAILERVERVYGYHVATKQPEAVPRAPSHPALMFLLARPDPYPMFGDLPKVALTTTLLDAPVATVSMLRAGLIALPDSQLNPPQDLKTLSTLLYLSYGNVKKVQEARSTFWVRACPSIDLAYPCEIYIAAFAIDGLEPGFYHFSANEFALRKLRDGPETLAHIKRGRPDLEFLKNVPAALLVSSVFARAASRQRVRAYRAALLDAGHLTENIIAAATGLGMETVTRLRMNENNMRELLGLPSGADFTQAESVQSMVVWSNPAPRPMVLPVQRGARPPLPQIPRRSLGNADSGTFPAVLIAHSDCIAPGFPVIEVRPPLTELSPIVDPVGPTNVPMTGDLSGGTAIRSILTDPQLVHEFLRQSIARERFLEINHVGFRGPAPWPIMPAGHYAGLIRPFWIINDVSGMDPGIWYYHPPSAHWNLLMRGGLRFEVTYTSNDQQTFGDAAAVCFMTANLHTLMTQGGPDIYRLAHLEAGMIAQRMHMAAAATGMGSIHNGVFLDDEARKLLGLHQSGWEIIYQIAVGTIRGVQKNEQPGLVFQDEDWRD